MPTDTYYLTDARAWQSSMAILHSARNLSEPVSWPNCLFLLSLRSTSLCNEKCNFSVSKHRDSRSCLWMRQPTIGLLSLETGFSRSLFFFLRRLRFQFIREHLQSREFCLCDLMNRTEHATTRQINQSNSNLQCGIFVAIFRLDRKWWKFFMCDFPRETWFARKVKMLVGYKDLVAARAITRASNSIYYVSTWLELLCRQIFPCCHKYKLKEFFDFQGEPFWTARRWTHDFKWLCTVDIFRHVRLLI